MDNTQYQSGDPRSVLCCAAGSGGTRELLWGVDTLQASMRMSHIIVRGGFLAITLSEYGAKTLSSFGVFSEGERVVYYVDSFQSIDGSVRPTLYGFFLAELEVEPKKLRLEDGFFNTIRFWDKDGNHDDRVLSFDFLTRGETEAARHRLQGLLFANAEKIREGEERIALFFSILEEEVETTRLRLAVLLHEEVDSEEIKQQLVTMLTNADAKKVTRILMALLSEADINAAKCRFAALLNECHYRSVTLNRMLTLLNA